LFQASQALDAIGARKKKLKLLALQQSMKLRQGFQYEFGL
jgi:hypothetical protein